MVASHCLLGVADIAFKLAFIGFNSVLNQAYKQK